MNKKDETLIFDVHKDAELEALAKAYVQAANKRKMTMTQASKIIAQIWREDITEPTQAKKLIQMPLDESACEAQFRSKVERLVDEYPEFIYHNGLKNNAEYRQYTITIICVIYKMFLEKDRIQGSTLLYYIRDYFKQVSENPDHSNTTTIHYFKENIFETLHSLIFATTQYSGIGCLRTVDTTFRPTIYKGRPDIQSIFRKIDKLVEPYLKIQEYECRKSKTITSIIQLIWFVETFF